MSFEIPATVTIQPDVIGKTVAAVRSELGFFLTLAVDKVPVTRTVVTFTDGTETVFYGANGIRYAVTTFIPDTEIAGIVHPNYLDLIEKFSKKRHEAAR